MLQWGGGGGRLPSPFSAFARPPHVLLESRSVRHSPHQITREEEVGKFAVCRKICGVAKCRLPSEMLFAMSMAAVSGRAYKSGGDNAVGGQVRRQARGRASAAWDAPSAPARLGRAG